MKLLNTLLTATDLSPASLPALERGCAIAAAQGARHTIVNALGLDALGPLRDLLGEQAEAVSSAAVAQQHQRLAERVGQAQQRQGGEAELRVEPGLATRVVPALGLELDADLMVIGARGESLLRRLLVGSTASRLLRKSHCPVLLVKNQPVGPYQRLLIPVDFSPGSELAIRLARELAPQAQLLLLHVFDVPFEGMLQYAGVSKDIVHQYRIEARSRALAQLHALAAAVGLEPGQYVGLVEYGDATQHITERLERSACDLVVLGKHGTHVTEELLLGSVTKRVLAETPVDALVVVDKRGPAAEAVGV